MEKITAKVISSRVYDNNWAVMSCVQGTKKYFRAAGTLLVDHEALKDTICDFSGEWETSPRFGMTFRFDSASPAGSEMFFFLSKVVRIGANVAQELCTCFGDEGVQTIMEDESRHSELLKVKGIGQAKLGKIVTSWGKYRHVKILSDFLTPYGITSNLVMRIHVHFEEKAVSSIRENPYVLTQVRGIGFRKADEIALKLGTATHDPFRIESCLKYVMNETADNTGHTLVEQSEVVVLAKKELETDTCIINCEEIGDVVKRMLVSATLTEVSGKLCLTYYYNIEKRIRHALQQRLLMTPCRIMSLDDTEKFILSMQNKMKIVFSDEQATAIRLVAAGHKTVVICGYAGTGKSTLSKALLQLLMSKHDATEICCMALSGIASDRIRKTSGFEASTIHTSLGWKGNQFVYGADCQLSHKVVLLDEGSMVNSVIMKQVIEAVDRDSVLILMGDPGQLPPIGAGDPFRDVIESEIVPVAKLTKIYRQSENSVLTMFANEVRQGRVPEGYLKTGGYKDFEFVEKNLPRNYYDAEDPIKDVMRQTNAHEITEVISQRLAAAAPYIKDPVADIQVLSPIKKGPLGTDTLNQLTQSVLNPIEDSEPSVCIGNAIFHVGDKVVHTQNKDMNVAKGSEEADYALAGDKYTRRVFNGSVGAVVAADKENREIMVAYPDGFVTQYDSVLLSAGTLIHAFTLTAHKCQGSEYKCVIFPVSSSHAMMLTAQWLYTAMTRASQKVVIVGQKYMFERCCKKLVESRRSTVLEQLLAA